MNFSVTKRDGTIEKLDIKKIQKYTIAACEGLKNVNASELEIGLKMHLKDFVKTSDIQWGLVQVAIEKIDIDRPDWTFVAARLFLYDLYHRVTGRSFYDSLEEHFSRGLAAKRIIPGLLEKFDLPRLENAIDPKRDELFTYLGIKTLYDRYLLKDERSLPIELPQHMFMGVAMFLAQNEDDPTGRAIDFYNVLSKFEVMCATPTLSNARTPRHQLSSCFIGVMPDNIEGIFDSYKEMALLSKYGGGIGWDFSKLRGISSPIDGHKNAAGGTIPFLRITNDVAIAVDQLGTRKGAIACYLEVWHSDILEFIDLRKNSGEERRRTHDIFPAVWICDLFMKRVAADETWSLFDAKDAQVLTESFGADFEEKYAALEADPKISRVKIKAKNLWKDILRNYFEAGLPFLGFKDNANRANPNAHTGIIHSSNLCTEIFQNTRENFYVMKIELEDGQILEFDEFEPVTVAALGSTQITKNANKITSLDTINGKRVLNTQKIAQLGETAVCNLASINLSRVNTKEDIAHVVPIAMRMLDNVVDLNFYPTKKSKITNAKTRAVGLGVMGEAQMLAEKGVHFGSDEHFEIIDEIMERISFAAIDESANLAKSRGFYPNFVGSAWSKGILPIDVANENARQILKREHVCDWEKLRLKVRRQGVRNGYMMAIAPTSSISILTGTTQTIEPIYKRKWLEENLSGVIPVVVPNLDPKTWGFYTSAYDLPQISLVQAAAIRQKWIDQGQSLNIFYKIGGASLKDLHELYTEAWRLGVKSTYYLRTQSPDTDETLVINRGIECEGCQ